jgi:hypothetical protein
MDEQIAEKTIPMDGPPVQQGPKGGQDLSTEIERAVEREPLDRVRCVRVFEDFYRCNWWSPAGDDAQRNQAVWASQAMHVVRKSRFLNATLRGGKLVIADVAGEAR